MTREEAILKWVIPAIRNTWNEKKCNEIIKALEQELRDCKTCIHSYKGKCAGTEECHECMWESKYEQEPCEDCISRQAVRHILNHEVKMPIKVWKKLFELVDCLPSVTPKPKTEVLDKIRAEIEQKARPNEIGGKGMKAEEIREGDIVEIDYITEFTKEHINEGKALVIWKGFNHQPLVRKLNTKTTIWTCYEHIARIVGHIDIEDFMDDVLEIIDKYKAESEE